MGNYFASDYHGPAFVLFGPAHLAALLTIVLLNLLLIAIQEIPMKKQSHTITVDLGYFTLVN